NPRNVRNNVKKSIRANRKNSAAGDPLELLLLQGSAGFTIRAPQDHGSYREVNCLVNHLQPVQVPAQRLSELKDRNCHYLHYQQGGSRQIGKGNSPGMVCQQLTGLWESQRKMQEQCRLQQPRDNARPVDRLVKRVQLARVMERIQNK